MRDEGILLHATEVEALTYKGCLKSDQRENIEALHAAVCDLLAEALGGSA
jgi:hypothetical protein